MEELVSVFFMPKPEGCLQGNDVFPIPGTKRTNFLEQNVAAVHIKLSKQELQELEEAVPESQVKGLRYDEAMMGGTYACYHKARPAQSTGQS